MSRKTLRLALIAGFVGLASHAARADERPAVKLRYERTADAADCPDASALRRSVAERLGYDPFVETSTSTVVARVGAASGGHSGAVSVLREDAPATAERTLFEPGSCHELIQTMALTISIALDPSSIARAAPPSPTSRFASPAVDEPARPSPPTVVRLGLGPSVTVGDSPAPVLGGIVYASLRKNWLGAVLEARGTFAGATDISAGNISSWSAGGLAAGCAYSSFWLFGCATAFVGVLEAKGEFQDGKSSSAPLFYAGPRVGVAVPLVGGALEFRLQADALWSFARHRISLGNTEVYEYAVGSFGGAALIGIRL